MNVWEWAALGYLAALTAPLVFTLRGSAFDRIIAQQFTSLLASVIVVVLAQAFGQSSYLIVALSLGALALPSALIYARFYERWL